MSDGPVTTPPGSLRAALPAPERVVTSPNDKRHINVHYVEWLEAENAELRQALKEEMAWDMGGVPENEWKRRAEAAEAKLARRRQGNPMAERDALQHRAWDDE